MKGLISIIIATYKRPKDLKNCLLSILCGAYEDFEIVVVDQSEDSKSRDVIEEISSSKIVYLKESKRGFSHSINLGIKSSEGEIIAITGDDCIVSKNWLKNFCHVFQKNQNIAAIFGKVLPYEGNLHGGKICPSLFLKKTKKIIEEPCLHSKNIGFGNNMAFKREVFEKIGGFKEWLGPASIGVAAEDAEFALRMLLNGYKLLYVPEVKIYHNRWLAKEEFRKQCLSYSCGEVACYGFLAFQGNKLGKKVIKNNFLDSWGKLKFSLKSLLFFKRGSLRLLYCTLQELFFRLKGLLVGFWFSKRDPLGLIPVHKS